MGSITFAIKSARRHGLPGVIDLSQRRAWFDETPPAPAPTPTPVLPQDAGSEELPDWVKDPVKALAEIKKVREEAAKYRLQLREAEKTQEKLQAEQKTAEDQKLAEQQEFEKLAARYKTDLDKALTELQTLRLDAMRNKVAGEIGIPSALAARLQGSTEEELKADAEALKTALGLTQTPQQQQARPGYTIVPGGQPVKETDDQRRLRLRSGGGSLFSGGGVRSGQ